MRWCVWRPPGPMTCQWYVGAPQSRVLGGAAFRVWGGEVTPGWAGSLSMVLSVTGRMVFVRVAVNTGVLP